MRIWNFTPHEINFVEGAEFNPAIRKFTGGDVVRTIPSDGQLNATLKSEEVANEDGIRIFKQVITGCDPLPAEIGLDDIVIVSALYATAYKSNGGVQTLYGVKDTVMTDDGKTFRGCRGLQIY